MHFETLQSISLNGAAHKPNDDRLGATARLAWVVDGATDMGLPGLLGEQGGAAWLASTASAAFAGATPPTLEETCLEVFASIETSFHAQRRRELLGRWELPKAAFSAVQLVDGVLEVAWLADCPVLLTSSHGTLWCTGEPDTSTEAAQALALGHGIGAADSFSGAVLADRRAARSEENHQALSPDAKASAAKTRFASFKVSPGDELLLMSDGFSSLVSDYCVYTAESLWDAVRKKGLAQLVQDIRAIERNDAACLKYPRFKVSDDATALWLKVV